MVFCKSIRKYFVEATASNHDKDVQLLKVQNYSEFHVNYVLIADKTNNNQKAKYKARQFELEVLKAIENTGNDEKIDDSKDSKILKIEGKQSVKVVDKFNGNKQVIIEEAKILKNNEIVTRNSAIYIENKELNEKKMVDNKKMAKINIKAENKLNENIEIVENKKIVENENIEIVENKKIVKNEKIVDKKLIVRANLEEEEEKRKLVEQKQIVNKKKDAPTPPPRTTSELTTPKQPTYIKLTKATNNENKTKTKKLKQEKTSNDTSNSTTYVKSNEEAQIDKEAIDASAAIIHQLNEATSSNELKPKGKYSKQASAIFFE